MNRSVTLNLTADDYVTANKLFVLKHVTSRWALIFWIMLVALLVSSLFVPTLRLAAPYFVPVFGICVTLAIALPMYQYFVGSALFARKSYAAQKNLQRPITVSWSEDGFRSTAQQGDWNVPWSDFMKWAENSEVFLLYQAPRLFNMFPKRVLTPAQVDDLRRFLAAHVKRA